MKHTMDTAPKDGTRIRAFAEWLPDGEIVHWPRTAPLDANGGMYWFNDDGDLAAFDFTHWEEVPDADPS